MGLSRRNEEVRTTVQKFISMLHNSPLHLSRAFNPGEAFRRRECETGAAKGARFYDSTQDSVLFARQPRVDETRDDRTDDRRNPEQPELVERPAADE